MTRYITWPKDIDEAFRVSYLSITGEAVQENPQETLDGNWCVGSGRITADQVSELQGMFENVVVVTMEQPEIRVIEEEI